MTDGPRILLLCTDLIFSSKILTTARLTGAEVHTNESHFGDGAPDLVLVDLDAERLFPEDAIRRLRERMPDVPIVAFVRHERVDLIQAARAAGASQVLARGAFSERLPAILAGPNGGDSPSGRQR
ncbi:response regulator [Vulgatibacter incomptus]|uniref:Response regulatory domain-containing protein n=1 Tax=Vulgatibacter incomptus TaxID=1391653 RepID=A0A0K1P9J8_9BACT|nr:response regulator [Vulgatibacter incomptus]AKU89769.1 hypothetical protein AKJ08_0156 [Vulgatibacter incomptus]